MADSVCRTIIISVVWLSCAAFLTFGLPELANHGLSPMDYLPFCMVMVFIVLAAATVVSIVIWLTRRQRLEPKSHGFEVIQAIPPADTKQG